MNWLELYNFLYNQANRLENIGKFNWQDQVKFKDQTTSKEFLIDNLVIDKENKCFLGLKN